MEWRWTQSPEEGTVCSDHILHPQELGLVHTSRPLKSLHSNPAVTRLNAVTDVRYVAGSFLVRPGWRTT